MNELTFAGYRGCGCAEEIIVCYCSCLLGSNLFDILIPLPMHLSHLGSHWNGFICITSSAALKRAQLLFNMLTYTYTIHHVHSIENHPQIRYQIIASISQQNSELQCTIYSSFMHPCNCFPSRGIRSLGNRRMS